ncbi:MAG: nitrilase-related carbon-nitrogen hydrolase, partial [Pseudomonadota bacterium]
MTPAPTHLRIALAQLNPTVGDIDGNIALARQAHTDAAAQGADLVVLPELFVTGYPPEDLVLKPAFALASKLAVEALASDLREGPGMIIGAVWPDGGKVYNAAVLIDDGAIQAVRTKVDLPNYGVFDEKRVFTAGPLPGPVSFRGVRIGVPICEDIWSDEVCECLAESGAEMLLVPNGSPFDWRKPDVRMN